MGNNKSSSQENINGRNREIREYRNSQTPDQINTQNTHTTQQKKPSLSQPKVNETQLSKTNGFSAEVPRYGNYTRVAVPIRPIQVSSTRNVENTQKPLKNILCPVGVEVKHSTNPNFNTSRNPERLNPPNNITYQQVQAPVELKSSTLHIATELTDENNLNEKTHTIKNFEKESLNITSKTKSQKLTNPESIKENIKITKNNFISKLCTEIVDEITCYKLQRLSAVSPDYQIASILFRNYMEDTDIVKIEYIHNPYLLALYTLNKSNLQSFRRDVEEILLFHGTNQTEIHSICRFNFNFRVYKNQGVCFSPYSVFADQYCSEEDGKKVMLLCKVLFDKYSKYRASVLIKSQDDTFYPQYRITYRD